MTSPLYTTPTSTYLFLPVLPLFLTLLQHIIAFQVQIPADGVTTCFFREIHSSSHVFVHYSSPDPVHVNIKAPSAEILYSERSTNNGEYTFDATEDGSYQICVSTDRIRRIPTTFRFYFWNPHILSPDIAQSHQVEGARNLCTEIATSSRNALRATHIYSDTAIATDNILRTSVTLAGRLAVIKCLAVLVVALSQITHIRRILVVARAKLQRTV